VIFRGWSRGGNFLIRHDTPPDVLAFERRHHSDRILVAVNFADNSVTFQFGETVTPVIRTCEAVGLGDTATTTTLMLAPHEAIGARIEHTPERT
jgi:glycosidase